MRRLSLAAAMLVTGAAWAAAAQEAARDLAAEIRARERALADAMHAKDRAGLERLLAPGYVLRGAPDIDRATWIGNAVTLCWGDRSDIDAFQLRPQDSTAIAAFELTFYVDPSTCTPAVLRSLITDVWVRGADGWQLLVRHSGPAAAGAGIAAQYGSVPQPPPAWELDAELSLVATGGNTSTRTLGLGGGALHRSGRTTTRGSLAFLTSEAEGVTQARSLAAQGRYGVQVREQLELFGRGAYAQDRFAGIENRVTTEGGVAYTASLPSRHTLTLEGGVGFTVERRLDASDLDFAIATGSVHYAWELFRNSDLIQDNTVTADLEDAGNWRGTSLTALSVELSERLSLKASHAVEYRNLPVAGFGRTDMRTAAALVFSWQRAPAAP